MYSTKDEIKLLFSHTLKKKNLKFKKEKPFAVKSKLYKKSHFRKL